MVRRLLSHGLTENMRITLTLYMGRESEMRREPNNLIELNGCGQHPPIKCWNNLIMVSHSLVRLLTESVGQLRDSLSTERFTDILNGHVR